MQEITLKTGETFNFNGYPITYIGVNFKRRFDTEVTHIIRIGDHPKKVIITESDLAVLLLCTK